MIEYLTVLALGSLVPAVILLPHVLRLLRPQSRPSDTELAAMTIRAKTQAHDRRIRK
jgi:hypothetical protein